MKGLYVRMDECYREKKVEKGNVNDRVDVFERTISESFFEMMILRKDLDDMKREFVNVWRRIILDKG